MKNRSLFCTDIDNTIICAEKPSEFGICVAVKNGKNMSYMTNASYDKFIEICKKIDVLFITTRCEESYKNIYLKKLVTRALVDNGAILVSDNLSDKISWYRESQDIVKEDRKDFGKARQILESYGYKEKWGSEFVLDYVISEPNNRIHAALLNELSVFDDTLLVNIGNTSAVVTYRKLSKGANIKRFAEKFGYSIFLSAGDGKEDVSMFDYSLFSIGRPDSGADYISSGSKLAFCDFVVNRAYELV